MKKKKKINGTSDSKIKIKWHKNDEMIKKIIKINDKNLQVKKWIKWHLHDFDINSTKIMN